MKTLSKTFSLRLAIPTLLLPVILGLSGCVEGPTRPVSNPQSPEIAGAPVVLYDNSLADRIAVDIVRYAPNPNHFLTVNANVRNRTDHKMEIQIQTLFYDWSGNVLNSEPGNETAWVSLVLSPNQTSAYSSQALSTHAARFTIRVRSVRSDD